MAAVSLRDPMSVNNASNAAAMATKEVPVQVADKKEDPWNQVHNVVLEYLFSNEEMQKKQTDVTAIKTALQWATVEEPTRVALRANSEALVERFNCNLRAGFSHFVTHVNSGLPLKGNLQFLRDPKYQHTTQTRKEVMKAAKHLNPKESIVVVCGPLPFDNEFVEPLREILPRCKKLYVLDYSQTNLDMTCKLLKSDKVVPKRIDLTRGAWEEWIKFRMGVVEHKMDYTLFTARLFSFFYGTPVTLSMLPIKPQKVFGTSGKRLRADLVISSLVGVEMTNIIKRDVLDFITQHFQKPEGEQFDPTHMDQFYKAVEYYTDEMTTLHAADLCAWTKKETGRVYCALDVARLTNGIPVHQVTDKAMNSVKGLGEVCSEASWTWVKAPDALFGIWAIVLKKIKQAASTPSTA